jgi:hypothetical protein
MAIDYPNSPTVGSSFTSGGFRWTWDGQKWNAGSGSGGQVWSVAGRTGDVVLTHIDITDWAAATPFLPLAGGTISGPLTVSGSMTANGSLTLSGNAAASLQAVPLQQLNSTVGGYLPLSGGTLSGALTVNGALTLSGNAAANLQAVPFQQLASTVGGYLPLTGGTITGALAVNSTMSVGSTLTVGGNTTIVGATLNVGNRIFLVVSGSYNILYDGSGNGALLAGGSGDQSNYYRNSSHYFQSVGGGSAFLYVQSGGVTCYVPLTANSTLTVGGAVTVNGVLTATSGGTAIYANNGNIYAAGSITANAQLVSNSGTSVFSLIQINGGGNAVYVPNGSVYAAGAITAASGTSTIFGLSINGGGTALSVPGGNASIGAQLNVGGDAYANNFYQNSDASLKWNIEPADTDCLAVLRNLSLVSYDRDTISSGGGIQRHVDVGVTAQDVRDYMPNAVVEQDSLLAVDLLALVAHLIGAVQQLAERLEAVEEIIVP